MTPSLLCPQLGLGRGADSCTLSEPPLASVEVAQGKQFPKVASRQVTRCRKVRMAPQGGIGTLAPTSWGPDGLQRRLGQSLQNLHPATPGTFPELSLPGVD
jgi:hypothetical protein